MNSENHTPDSTSPLVILHLITGLGSGGAERMLTRIALADFGTGAPRQIVVSLMDEGVHGPTLREAGIELHCLGLRRSMPSPWAFIRLVRLLRRLKPDILMTWLYHADLLGTLAAPLAGIRKLVWNLRCSDINFQCYAYTTRWIVRFLAHLSPLPWAVATNSRAGRKAHEALGYTPRHWVHLPNGFDLDTWHPSPVDRAAVRAELDLHEDEIAVCMVARVDPQKDHPTLLAAADILSIDWPGTRLVLVGRGTETLIPASGADRRVIALGERRDIPRLLRGFDIAVLSSAYGEGLPNAIGEAMATALPCIVTDVGDSADLVGETGIVVPVGQPLALASAIATLIEEGAGQRQERGKQARKRIMEGWSLNRSIEAYRKVWRDMAADTRV